MQADGIEISEIAIEKDIVDKVEEQSKEASEAVDKYTKAMQGFAPTDEDKKKMEEQVQNKKSAENKDGDKKDGKKVAEPTKFNAGDEQHQVWVEDAGANPQVLIASTPMEFGEATTSSIGFIA